MLSPDLQLDYQAIADNRALYEEENFVGRFQALDFLEFNVLDRVEGLLPLASSQGPLLELRRRAERLRQQLESLDQQLFYRLRQTMRESRITGAAFKSMVKVYYESTPSQSEHSDSIGYDALDAFVNGLLHFESIPAETLALEPGMVYYQKTPARIVWQMAEKAGLKSGDIFLDLGSGLGQVSILMHLLTGAQTKGIEFEPVYCDYARACAADLHLQKVEFERIDAREADFSVGKVFFLYTPFEGPIFTAVMQRLRNMAQGHIKIFTYGPCTLEMSRQAWLQRIDSNPLSIHQLAAFERR